MSRLVAVDRTALRKAACGAQRAADRLAERAVAARAGLDGAASRHPALVSSPVLTSVAESWRSRLDSVVTGVDGFGALVGRALDGYDRAEEGASAILRKFLGDR